MILVLLVWGCWEVIDYFWIDEKIESSQPIEPEIFGAEHFDWDPLFLFVRRFTFSTNCVTFVLSMEK